MSGEEKLAPNFRKLEEALRSIGYSFEAAVADVIDNSIDAEATKVWCRILTRGEGYLDLAIWDNGEGMDESTLKEAMRFGSDVSQSLDRLGKFGLGLKLASLSQAKELRVFTWQGHDIYGRAWLERGIAKGFSSTVFEKAECSRLVSEIVPDLRKGRSGTVVWWSQLYRVGHHGGRTDENAQKLMHRLEKYLALAFHRFLQGKLRKVAITLDIYDQIARRAGIPIDLDPLDPFGYPETGHRDFPASMSLDGKYKNRISIKAHVWPPNSDAAEYKLPGGSNSRQGFYFYRNNRLIQGGGWNDIREVEPHSSLARVEIDIAPDFDIDVSLDVKKVEIHLPLDLAQAIQKAKTPNGVDFKKYLATANDAYRTRPVTDSELPLIPSQGLPSELVDFLHKKLRIKATAKHRDLKFRWKNLSDDSFFEINRDKGYLYLNQTYRKQVLHGLGGSSADVPVLKCLLFLVLENALVSERMGPRVREQVELVNSILVEAVKFERG